MTRCSYVTNEIQQKNKDDIDQEIPYIWLDLDIDPEEIDIKEFIKVDGTIYCNAIFEDIRKDIFVCYKETVQWQYVAILASFPTD